MSVYQRLGLAGLLGMVALGVISALPPEDTHAHAVGPHDTLTKVAMEPDAPALEQVAEPVRDFWRFVAPDVASAHYPMPKVCAHYDYVKPNHTYFLERHYWSGYYHYHGGWMEHAVGSDYRYTFRCGSKSHHYKTLPSGWW